MLNVAAPIDKHSILLQKVINNRLKRFITLAPGIKAVSPSFSLRESGLIYFFHKILFLQGYDDTAHF